MKKSLFHHFHPFKVVLHFLKCFVCAAFEGLSPKDSVPGPYEILGLSHRHRLVYFGLDSALVLVE